MVSSRNSTTPRVIRAIRRTVQEDQGLEISSKKKKNKQGKLTLQIDVTRTARIPLEALATAPRGLPLTAAIELIRSQLLAGAMVVTSLAAHRLCRALSSRIDRIRRHIGVALAATARIRTAQIEAVRMLTAVVKHVHAIALRALIKVYKFILF